MSGGAAGIGTEPFGMTCLYDDSTPLPTENPHAEVARSIVRKAFFQGLDTGTLRKCLDQVEEGSNFTIIKIEAIEKSPAGFVQQAYRQAHGIANDRNEVWTTYHGSVKAETVAQQGFRGAMSRRAMIGKGIYTSTNFWEALSYCIPDAEWKVRVLIVRNLVGLHAVGSKDQEDFGRHENGRAINTLTNEKKTILCSKHEGQLCAIGMITLRYRIMVKPTEAHHAFVGRKYNQYLVERVNAVWPPAAGVVLAAGAAAAGDDAAARAARAELSARVIAAARAAQAAARAAGKAKAAAAAAAAPAPAVDVPRATWKDTPHHFFAVDKDCFIDRAFSDRYTEFVGFEGKVVKTMARPTGKGTLLEWNFFVQLTHGKDGKLLDDAAKIRIESMLLDKNGSGFKYFKGLDRSSFLRYLPCRVMGLRSVRDRTADAADEQGGAKKARHAEAGPAGAP